MQSASAARAPRVGSRAPNGKRGRIILPVAAMSANDAVVQLRGELRDLEARKEALELEIESAQSWLTSQGLDPAQLPLRLTDAEGFPLPNVDHHAARIHAQSMRTALNDHKRVVARLADVLGEYHDAMRNNKAPAEGLLRLAILHSRPYCIVVCSACDPAPAVAHCCFS